MGKRLPTRSDSVYVFILALVLATWFSPSQVPVIAKPHNDEKVVQKAVSISPETLRVSSLRPGGECNIEYINGAQMSDVVHSVKKGQHVEISGWGIDKEKLRIPDRVVAHLKSEAGVDYYYLATAGLPRPDVVDYFNLPLTLINSGFVLDLSETEIQPGFYSVSLILLFGDFDQRCDNRRKLHIY
ncbi:hypothetical protein [Methylocaldum gracile]